MKFKILGLIMLVLVVLQFIPYGRDHTNPPIAAEPAWDSPRTRELFFRACADCHSNETAWPWYSRVAPASWLVQHDVNEARGHFNVSMWGAQDRNKGDEAVAELATGEMPPWFYRLPHPEAKLSDTEKQDLMTGLAATFIRPEEGP